MDIRGVSKRLRRPLGLLVTLALGLLLGQIAPQARAGQRPAAPVLPQCTLQIPSKTIILVPACCDDFLRQVADPPAWQNAAGAPWGAGAGWEHRALLCLCYPRPLDSAAGQQRAVWGVTLLGHVPGHAQDQGAGVAADPRAGRSHVLGGNTPVRRLHHGT